MDIYPIIMCGGAGTRLWPTSRPAQPKQFVPLIGDVSLFALTVARARKIRGMKQLIIVAGQAHEAAIRRDLGSGHQDIIFLEPKGRDSAPAIAIATEWIARKDVRAIGVVMASDHYIPDDDIFIDVVHRASLAAVEGRIVTMGIRPVEPNSAYGYIKPVSATSGQSGGDILHVDAFVEKPDLITASRYMDEGYLWNSGNFIFSADTMRSELTQYSPEIANAARLALDQSDLNSNTIVLGEPFLTAPKISIDFAVMEKTRKAAVLPTDLRWSDLGAWDAVKQVSTSDENANALASRTYAVNSKGCLVRGNGNQAISIVGLENVAVIVESDAVLVTSLSQAQNVKAAVHAMAKVDDSALDFADPIEAQTLHELGVTLKKWLFNSALPLWATLGTDYDGWGFYESLYQRGTAQSVDRRVRVQARQVHVFATAAGMGWNGPVCQLIEKGFDGLSKYYLRPDGLIRTLVSAEGISVDDTALIYDQAFLLLALASARPFVEETEGRAHDLLEKITHTFGADNGGFRESSAQPWQSNPHMHLFEASLAWIERSDDRRWRELGRQIYELARTKLFDPDKKILREFYTADWTPANGDDGQIVEPGHQFEWAWLLVRWGKIFKDQDAIDLAFQLYDAGCKGIDQARNVAIDAMTVDAQPLNSRARLWPQTERLKAALALSLLVGPEQKSDLLEDARRAAISLSKYLATPIKGLWWDKISQENQFTDEPASASSLYHIIEAIGELERAQLC